MPQSRRLRVETHARTEFVPLAERIGAEAGQILETDGVLVVSVPHTTAAICVNEGYDPDVMADVERVLDRLVPWKADYRHAEGNTAAHVKTILVGSSVSLPVRRGALELGQWQEIFLCEFDGPRVRTVVLTLLPA
ncbi:MAG TPA: secondary thiamine-phosphate synthase enzyme YjbQ [Candidatus Eisenbacteria bacterium]|nr:secondary thiamine-phosphate synthase enzyme YjbQ [Candidatus Eisenbacteria bacterium]